jgi:hypothetical protein
MNEQQDLTLMSQDLAVVTPVPRVPMLKLALRQADEASMITENNPIVIRRGGLLD